MKDADREDAQAVERRLAEDADWSEEKRTVRELQESLEALKKTIHGLMDQVEEMKKELDDDEK